MDAPASATMVERPAAAPRTHRVLDLACGAGLVRVTVAQRLPAREVHYLGVDPSRSRLQRIRDLLPGARALVTAAGVAGAGAAPSLADELQARVVERFVRVELDLHDAAALAAQLAQLDGDERCDEIHLHLLHPGTHGAQASGPRVLRVLARRLRPGGRLYHLFQRASPLFDFQPRRIGSSAQDAAPPQERHAGVLRADAESFRLGARRGGLLLARCGHLWTRNGPRRADGTWGPATRAWVSQPCGAAAAAARLAERYAGLVERHSLFAAYATHFVILRRRGRRRGAAR